MNNRYLYRAKRTDNGEWVIGFYAFIGMKEVIIQKEPEKYYCIDNEKNSSGNKILEVDPSTICQCTGLKDKNGKLIWENDILVGYLDDEYPEDETYEKVIWCKSGFYTVEQGSDDASELDDFTGKYFEVCGNIFDNPEMLEVRE